MTLNKRIGHGKRDQGRHAERLMLEKTARIGACPFKRVVPPLLQISQATPLQLFPRKRLTVLCSGFYSLEFTRIHLGTRVLPYSLPGRSSLTKSHNGRLPPGLLKLKKVRCFPWSRDFYGDPSVPTSIPLPTTQDIFLDQGISLKTPLSSHNSASLEAIPFSEVLLWDWKRSLYLPLRFLVC